MKLLIINGPNLNMLGERDPAYYGVKTLAEIEKQVREKADESELEIEFFQSNHEGAIVDKVQGAALDFSGIIINPGALTTYGMSLRDALVDTNLAIVEVHLSNIHGREEFRKHSIFAPIAVGQITGLGWQGYLFAVGFLSEYLSTKSI